MAPRKSQRISNKSFKTVTCKEPISIEDNSSSSEKTLSLSTSPPRTREIRSKLHQDSTMNLEKTLDKSSGKKRVEEHTSGSDPESITEVFTEKKKKKSPKDSVKKRKETGSAQTENPQSSKKQKTKDFNVVLPFKKVKIHDCSFLDFGYFKKNGFYWNEWLDNVGARNLCNLTGDVVGEMVEEFYRNLQYENPDRLKSRVQGVTMTISRADLINCFGLKDNHDDNSYVSMRKSELFLLINRNVGEFPDEDVFVHEFELVVRILHKVVRECILPRKGSTTTVSKEDGLIILAMLKRVKIDLAKRILKRMWREQEFRIYGNVLMEIFKFKKIPIPRKIKFPIRLKRIGEKSMHHMQIRPYKKFWHAVDGAIYLHKKHRKNVDWERIKATFEGEQEPTPEASPEVSMEGQKDKEKQDSKGKAPLKKKSHKDFTPMTGGKFQINEDALVDTSSDSDSSELPKFPEGPGEASTVHTGGSIALQIQQSLEVFKDEFKKFISSEIKNQLSTPQHPPSKPLSDSARSYVRPSPPASKPFPEAVSTDTSTASGVSRFRTPYEPTPSNLSLVPYIPLDVVQRPHLYLPQSTSPSPPTSIPPAGFHRRQKQKARKNTIQFSKK